MMIPQRLQDLSLIPTGSGPKNRWGTTSKAITPHLDCAHHFLVLQPAYCSLHLLLCPKIPPRHCHFLTVSSAESLSSIISLAVSCLYPKVMGSWRVFLPSSLANKRHCDSPSHLRMNELALASILLIAAEATLNRFSGHITLGYKVKL